MSTDMGLPTWWVEQAKAAHAAFMITNQGPLWIEAEADTGSRYLVYRTLSAPGQGANWLVVVRQPWVAAYEAHSHGILHAGYTLTKWGKDHRMLTEHHGGDAFAIAFAIAVLLGRGLDFPGIGIVSPVGGWES